MLDTEHQQNLCSSSRLQIQEARGGGETSTGAVNIMVNMRHQWLESNKSNQELSIKAQWCWMFWDWNVQRQHNQNSAQTHANKTALHICTLLGKQLTNTKLWSICFSLTFKWATLYKEMTRGWGGTAESKQRTPRVRWYVWRAKFCPFKTVFLLRISYQIITNDYKPVKIKYFLSLKKRDFKVRRKKSRLLLMVYLHLHVSQ